MLLVEAGWRRLALCCGLQFFARLSVVVDHALREIVDLPILRLVDRELARLDFEHVAIRGLVHEIGRTHVLRGGGSSSRHLRARWWRVAPWRGTVLRQSWGGPQRGCDEVGGHMLRKHHSLLFHVDLMADKERTAAIDLRFRPRAAGRKAQVQDRGTSAGTGHHIAAGEQLRYDAAADETASSNDH